MTDERYQKIMAELGMPNSRSLLQALQQVANEVAQETHSVLNARLQRGECICLKCGLRQDSYDAAAHAAAYPGF